MKITIENIELEHPVPISQRVMGYRGQFSCSLVYGSAILIPYSGAKSNLMVGNAISVETGQESISNFHILEEISKPQFLPLANPGDFSIIGKVSLNGENEVFYIDVAGFTFTLDVDETNGQVPNTGKWVSFNLHGLQFWDENI